MNHTESSRDEAFQKRELGEDNLIDDDNDEGDDDEEEK